MCPIWYFALDTLDKISNMSFSKQGFNDYSTKLFKRDTPQNVICVYVPKYDNLALDSSKIVPPR